MEFNLKKCAHAHFKNLRLENFRRSAKGLPAPARTGHIRIIYF